jgi:membrane protease YdiL (CAAX protease family)
MSSSSSLANMFGEPGKGIHTHVFGIAIFDVLLTLIAAVVLHKAYPGVSILLWFIGLIVLGILAHRAFGVKTKLNNIILGDN